MDEPRSDMTAARPCLLCGGEAKRLGGMNLLGILETSNYQCAQCGSLFRSPMPSHAELADHYAGDSSRYPPHLQKKMAVSQAQWLVRAQQENGLESGAPGSLYLEYGAGQGWMVAEAVAQAITDRAVGVEASESAVEWGRRTLEVDLRQGFFGSNSGGDDIGGAAIVAMMHVLEHLSEPREVIATVRAQHPLALLFLEVPDATYEVPVIARDSFCSSPLGEHLWSFSDSGLRHLLTSEGYQIVHLSTTGDPAYWSSKLRSLEVAHLYQNLFADWEKNGGGNIDIIRRCLRVLGSAALTGLRNGVQRKSRDQLPSLRVLARPN